MGQSGDKISDLVTHSAVMDQLILICLGLLSQFGRVVETSVDHVPGNVGAGFIRMSAQGDDPVEF